MAPVRPSSSSSSDTAVDENSHGDDHSRSRNDVNAPSLVAHVRAGFATLLELVFKVPYLVGLQITLLGYYIYQWIVDLLFTVPYRPLKDNQKPFGRIAIIGAGLTGISSAAHCVSHGFEVVIYDSDDKIGGVWSNVNSTSQLQLNSLMYRFHPSVKWSKGFPKRDEIVSEIKKLADRYNLQGSLRLQTPVKKVTRHKELSTDPKEGGHARWVINDGQDGVFDAVIVSIGTCGKPKMIKFEGQDDFKGKILHSSQLDNAELKGKKVVIVGSGASGVEAAELAVEKRASKIVVLARDDKWIIPRNTVFDVALALQFFGRPSPLSFIPEWFIRLTHYRSLKDLSPQHTRLFESTPIVNNDFLSHIRQGIVEYKRGDTQGLTSDGVKFTLRGVKSKSGDPGIDKIEQADVVVLATGYERPSIDMLPKDLFPKEGDRDYDRPNLYLQTLSVEDWSVVLTNSSYMDAIGVVGGFHIGLYARILMMFLLDKRCRPIPKAMKLWVDFLTWIKFTAWGEIDTSAMAFFTYSELCLWVVSFHLFRVYRLLWLPFVLFGWGIHPQPQQVSKKTK
ncbi:hypothetical protein OIO90_002712 [Microbotryomycetes sp. JL221]|nr:hypothetical protein OIO90_002712 [Microbotryomycetes sp. JL221]